MIDKIRVRDIDINTDEGRLLLSALSILTSISEDDIRKSKWGGTIHPDNAMVKIVDLANKIFYEKEYASEKKRKRKEKNRTRLINNILK